MEHLPFSFPVTEPEITRRRLLILSTLCASDNGFCTIPVSSVRKQTLNQMLRLYDELFLAGFLEKFYGSIDVTLSNRLTSSAGKFIYTRNSTEQMSRVEIQLVRRLSIQIKARTVCTQWFIRFHSSGGLSGCI